MINKKSKTFTTDNNQYIKGDFVGKYETKRIDSRGGVNFSEFILTESNIKNGTKCAFNEVLTIDRNFLEKKHVKNISISLSNSKIPENYIFREDVYSVLIYDIDLSEQMLEGIKVFGVIKGKIICSLKSQPDTIKYMPDEDIVIETPKKIIQEEEEIIEEVNDTNWFDFMPENIDGIDYLIRLYFAAILLIFSIVLYDAINDSILFSGIAIILSAWLVASTTHKRCHRLSFLPAGHFMTILNTLFVIMIFIYSIEVTFYKFQENTDFWIGLSAILLILNLVLIVKPRKD